MELVLFDLDNTLLIGDSDYEWARFLIEKGILDGASYETRNDEFFAQYKVGTLNILEFLDFQLAPLAQYPMTQLHAWHAEFMEAKIRPMIEQAARDLVKRHLQAGSLCVVITATNSFVTAPIVREFGIPNLIATEPELKEGRYTGRPFGTPCFQAGKVVRIHEWLGSMGKSLDDYSRSWFYSDSRNDLPLLELVSDPVAVDPDDTLRAAAESRGWPVISLRGAGKS